MSWVCMEPFPKTPTRPGSPGNGRGNGRGGGGGGDPEEGGCDHEDVPTCQVSTEDALFTPEVLHTCQVKPTMSFTQRDATYWVRSGIQLICLSSKVFFAMSTSISIYIISVHIYHCTYMNMNIHISQMCLLYIFV